MKAVLLSFACLVAIAKVSEGLIPPPEHCPQVCSFLVDPKCSVGSCDDFRTFSNDCLRKNYNCMNLTNYRPVAKGPCIQDVQDVHPAGSNGGTPL